MSPKEINEAIAKSIGWHSFEVNFKNQQFGWMPCPLEWDGPQYHAVPDYCNDLNAMHEVEKTLSDEQYLLFFELLYQTACKTTKSDDTIKYKRVWVSATAAQRAEMYLRVKGLWL